MESNQLIAISSGYAYYHRTEPISKAKIREDAVELRFALTCFEDKIIKEIFVQIIYNLAN